MDGIRVIAVAPYGPIRGDSVSALPAVEWGKQQWQGQLYSTATYPFAGAETIPEGIASAATFELRHFLAFALRAPPLLGLRPRPRLPGER
eukprot:1951467-Lingulodinium_polyedra.AAC.1